MWHHPQNGVKQMFASAATQRLQNVPALVTVVKTSILSAITKFMHPLAIIYYVVQTKESYYCNLI